MVPELYPRGVRPALLLAVLAALVATGPGAAQTGSAYEIVVVPGLELADLEELERPEAAVGLLVPANGPETSGAAGADGARPRGARELAPRRHPGGPGARALPGGFPRGVRGRLDELRAARPSRVG